MSTWLERLSFQPVSKSSPTVKINSTKRRRRSRRAAQLASPSSTATNKNLIQVFGTKFNRFTSVEYNALKQQDPESGNKAENLLSSSDESVDKNESSSGNSSSEEDLFATPSAQTRRQLRRKMTRSATYSMRDTLESSRQNLFYSEQKIRRLRIILGTIFLIVVIALLATALVFIIKGNDEPTVRPAKKTNTIQLEDVLFGRLSPLDLNATWYGSELMYRDNTDLSIVSFDIKTKKRTVVMRDVLRQYTSFQKSADGKFLLLTKVVNKIFRHSFKALYDIYDLTTGQFHPLLHAGEQHFLSLVKWAPVGNALIFNFAGNLYYKRSALKDSEVVAITNDAGPNILNGIPDWIYEEEVLSSNSAVWFNPNGTQIAFVQFDNSATYYMNIQEYGEAGDLRFQYPLMKRVPYPKPGSPNPRVKLFTADLTRVGDGSDTHLTDVPVPSALNTESDYLIVGVLWLNNDLMLSSWMNRIQNQLHMQVYNGLRRYNLYSMESKTGWISNFDALVKNRDGSQIALILPQRQGNDGNYRHLCLLQVRNQNEEPEALTRGKYEVQSILHWDHSTNIIFFTANTETNSEELHVYGIRLSGPVRNRMCLTCSLHVSGGIKQEYYSAEFNNDNQVAITSMGPGIPMTDIREWKIGALLNSINMEHLMDWETNKRIRGEIDKLAMPQREFHSIPIANGFTAKVLLNLPPNMDRSGETKYPMLVEVYGGPDSYAAIDRWMIDWGMYLTSNQSVIYAKIDGRGSGLRGEQLLHSIYLKLGTLEIEDQINVTRQLQQKFNFIDAEHTGIWGWSYGGYASAMALANDENKVFRCAASIAPVTDWAYYDSIYTERYMSLPKLNEPGYNNSRLTTRASRLRGKKYMLIHGTLDDNVHYQQALVLAKNLERQNILFKQISYTDEDHGLVHVRPHLYHSLDNFFGDCFDQQSLIRARK